MSEELRSCPFCGIATDEEFFCAPRAEKNTAHNWQVICDRCGARGPIEEDPTVAAVNWNAAQASLTARIAALEAALRHADAALEPMVAKAIGMDGDPEWTGNGRRHDDEHWPIYFYVRDLRRAREARAAAKVVIGEQE